MRITANFPLGADQGRRKNAGEIGTRNPAALAGVENLGLAVASASVSAAPQNAASIVFDSRHDEAARRASTDHEDRLLRQAFLIKAFLMRPTTAVTIPPMMPPPANCPANVPISNPPAPLAALLRAGIKSQQD
jgi:hypothetical protein